MAAVNASSGDDATTVGFSHEYDDYCDFAEYYEDCVANSSSNISAPAPEPLVREFKIACFVVYSIIFVIGTVGNVLFSYIVISSRSMKNVTYHLLVNLSLSDLLISVFCGPLHVLYVLVMGYWPFGSFVCYGFSYVQSISLCVNSYTLVVISFERYMSILHPLRQIIPKGTSKYVILAIWAFALLLSIPTVVHTRHHDVSDKVGQDNFWICDSEMDQTFHIISVVFLFLLYILPVMLMTFFYSMVAKTIWSHRNEISVLMDTNSIARVAKELQMLKSKRTMIKMLIVVVACYTICWLPFHVYHILGLILPKMMEHPSFPYVFTVVHILVVSHTCINPFIYCWMNRRVRYGFMDVMGKLRIVRRCFPNVDWESTRITRNARQTQYTVRRKRGARNSVNGVAGSFTSHGGSLLGHPRTGIIGNQCTHEPSHLRRDRRPRPSVMPREYRAAMSLDLSTFGEMVREEEEALEAETSLCTARDNRAAVREARKHTISTGSNSSEASDIFGDSSLPRQPPATSGASGRGVYAGNYSHARGSKKISTVSTTTVISEISNYTSSSNANCEMIGESGEDDADDESEDEKET